MVRHRERPWVTGTTMVLTLLVLTAVMGWALLPGPASAHSYLTGSHVPESPGSSHGFSTTAHGTSPRVFNLSISIYRNSPVPESVRNEYEEIVEFMADGVCEQSNGAHRLGTVRLFPDNGFKANADIRWQTNTHPSANPGGFHNSWLNINMADTFVDGCGDTCHLQWVGPTSTTTGTRDADHDGAGYTLAHEWGHYVYSLYDEYSGDAPDTSDIAAPRASDTPTTEVIMNHQWHATDGGPYTWLNHSTDDQYNSNNVNRTAQGRVYGKSAWETLVQSPNNDPSVNKWGVVYRRKWDKLENHMPTPGSDTGLRAVTRTGLLVEWSDSAGEMIGSTTSTDDVSELVTYNLVYDLSQETTRLYHEMGFDTSPGSGDFGYYYADQWEEGWQRDSEVSVSVESDPAGDGIEVHVKGLTRDLPGALGAAGSSSSSSGGGGGGGGGCLIERSGLPKPVLGELRGWRDWAMDSSAGRWVARTYYRYLGADSR